MIKVKDAIIVTDEEGGDVEYDFSQMTISVNGCAYVLNLPPSMTRKEAEAFAEDYTTQIRRMVIHLHANILEGARRRMREAMGI